MSWKLYRWVWRLESPLFIGMPPAGSLARCRCYVPARTLAGALAAERARTCGSQDKNGLPDYGKLGHELGKNCRFTYLFPAQRTDDKYRAWLPSYQKGERLVWQSQDGQAESPPISDREFRRCLLDSRPATAIDPHTDSAAEATLRETECLLPFWRCLPGKTQAGVEAVFLLGYVFLLEGSFRRKLQETKTLFLGGDTRYGLGRVRQVAWEEAGTVFGKEVEPTDKPTVKSNTILAHTTGERDDLRGQVEILGGWPLNQMRQDHRVWAPGSTCEEDISWTIDEYGYWKKST